MKLIERHIKAKLKENYDLFDSKAHIDSSLSYTEQQAEIQEKLNLIIDRPTQDKQAIDSTLKALQDEQEQAITQNLKHIHRIVRAGFKQLKTGQVITHLINI